MNTILMENTSGTHVETVTVTSSDDNLDDNLLVELYDTMAMQEHWQAHKLQQWQELLSWYAGGG